MNFSQNEDNKQALYPFLADSLKEADPQNIVFVSKEDGAIANVDACSHLTMNLSCNHEEANTRLFVHEKLGKEKSRALLFFHAFIDCDSVSGFKGKCMQEDVVPNVD